MQKIIADSYLGRIQYSEEHDLYQGNFSLEENQTIEFSFDVDDNLEAMLEITRNVVEKIKSSDREFELYIAKHLLDLYNGDWSEFESRQN